MGSEPGAAAELASRMLSPWVVDEGFRSGLFLVRQPDAERWHAFAQALVAELQRLGAVVMFVDMAELGAAAPGTLQQELRSKLFALREQFSPMETVRRRDPGADTLSDLILSIVDLSRSHMVLIFDHAGRLRGQTGEHMLKALKAARDAVNVRPDANRKFFLIAVDTDTSAVNELARDPAQAFLGATVMELMGP